ncbi:MAG: MBL fold metallo-hydrolase [Lachnospiraceae bacterium]|nr:MBL fold metallo-hydrolase [Lachnospiraceae bacterium]
MCLMCLLCFRRMVPAAEQKDSLSVCVLDVGEGLAVYAACGDHAMLYDGGGRDTASRVVNELRGRGVETLDYAVVSHYDDDHLAGVIGALHVFGCGLILAPDYIGSTTIYTSFAAFVEQEGIPCEAPAVGNVYPLGEARIEILAPDGFDAERENDRCIAVRITCGDRALLLCGDAEEEEESFIAGSPIEAAADVYVVDHHGSSTSSTDAFLNRVRPSFAVISCGEANEFGHPSEKTLHTLAGRGIRIYRTDRQGDISFTMDDDGVRFEQEPTADLSPGSNFGKGEGRGDGEQLQTRLPYRYICNFKTFIFHRPDCETVARMSEKNKVYSNEGRQELIALGYRACGICRP